MSDYYDEPEPPPAPELEDAPLAEEKTVTIELKVSPEAIVRAAVDRMLNAYERGGMGDVIEKQVRLRVDKLVEARVEELVRTRCEEIVNKLIDEGLRNGFPQYDAYGRSEKRTETLEQIVRKALDPNRNLAGYNEPKVNLVEYTLNKAIGSELKPIIDAEVKKLVAAAREQVQTKFATALAATLAR